MPMKIRQVVFGLLALIGFGIAFGVGRYFQRPATRPNNTRCITVFAGSTAGKCYVDYPVAVLHYTDQDTDRVQWFSNDDKYSVTFLNIAPPPGYPPLPTNPPYTPESPLAPPQEPVYFDSSNPSGAFNVKHKDKYYYYAIFDLTHPTTIPCKVSTDDQDTGLNVKR
jgi:hypothetical protein